MPVHRAPLRRCFLACAVFSSAVPVTPGQSPSSRFEVGGQFSDLKLIDTCGNASFTLGFGGRLDWNLTPRIALDTQIDFFPRSYPPSQQQGGWTSQLLAGARGRIVHRKRYAIYGLMRPGLTYASNEVTSFSATTTGGSQSVFLFTPNYGGEAHFTIELGGGVEFYPSERWILRAELEASPYFVGNTPVTYTSAPPQEGIRAVSAPGVTGRARCSPTHQIIATPTCPTGVAAGALRRPEGTTDLLFTLSAAMEPLPVKQVSRLRKQPAEVEPAACGFRTFARVNRSSTWPSWSSFSTKFSRDRSLAAC